MPCSSVGGRRRTSHVAAGMLAPVSEAAAAEQPLLELGLRERRSYPALCRRVDRRRRRAGSAMTACGTLLVARDVDEARALDRELELRRRFGLSVRAAAPERGETARAGAGADAAARA